MEWYFGQVYGTWEGPGVLPFYCDPSRVGAFAVGSDDLAAGHPDAIFKLFVALAMYQARRDRLIMAQQKAMTADEAAVLTSAATLAQRISQTPCDVLQASPERFDEACDVFLEGGRTDCLRAPAQDCPVKDASQLLKRMADLGKLPVSAWKHLRHEEALQHAFSEVLAREPAPEQRAELLVAFVTRVFRVGRKLATLFVSALSTPALAPGHTPWYPAVSGYDLVVLDTNVGAVIDRLRGPRSQVTAAARTAWLKQQASQLDLRPYGADLPVHSARLVQQAMYWFGSASNRVVHGDPCAGPIGAPCGTCVPRACPFDGGRSAAPTPEAAPRATTP